MQNQRMIPYVLGIDSGGTKYLVRAAALDGTILAEYQGPPCSHYQMPFEAAALRIADNLAQCLARFGGQPRDCRCIVCGTTGYDSPEDGEILQRLYEGLAGFSCPILCMNDVELAFHIACSDEGVMILAGTGSICFAKTRRGDSLRVGGWPCSLFGDEGSGRYIDALALRHFSRWLDGCRPESPFLQSIQAHIGIHSRKELMDFAADLQKGDVPTPGLGAIVSAAAEQGDDEAKSILLDAAESLFRLVQEAIQKLHMDALDVLPVGIWGSVLMKSAVVRDELTRLLKAAYPNVRMCIPVKDAAQGAVEIALAHGSGGQP